MIEAAAGAVGAAILLLGLTLTSIGLYGMLRRPAIFEQLHAAGLIAGPGAILVLIAALASGSAEIATSAMLVVAFVLVTSSLSTHAIALAAWRVGPAAEAAGRPDAATPAVPGGEQGAAPTAMRVLVAHDGSPSAEVATSLVGSLPWPRGTVIRVIGAVEGDLRPVGDPGGQPAPASVDLATAVRAAAGRLQRTGIDVDHVVHRGDAASAIERGAADFGANLVVIGSRGLGPVRTILVGSVAAAVVDAAPCSVLVARTTTIEEVLLATDGSGPSDVATDVVGRWQIFRDSRIRVLTVATGSPQYGDRPRGGAMRNVVETARQQRVADSAAMRLRDAGRQALPYVLSGDAPAQIMNFAAVRSVDLIVIGSRGRTGLERALLGSVGRAVLSSAGGSVLVVKASSSPDP